MSARGFDRVREMAKAGLDAALYAVGEEIGREIETAYESVIDAFYESYTPHRYDRTKATYYGSDSYPVVKDPVMENDVLTAGIEVSPSNITGSPYRADKDWVFERTFVKGYHGYTDREIRSWRQRSNIRELIKAKKYYYYRPKEMRAMSPPPNKLMEKKMREMKRSWKAKINKVFTDELTKALS